MALRRLRLERSSEGECSSSSPLELLCCPSLPPARRPRLNAAAAVSDGTPSGGQQQQRWEQVDARDRQWHCTQCSRGARPLLCTTCGQARCGDERAARALPCRNIFFTPVAVCPLSVLWPQFDPTHTGSTCSCALPPVHSRRLCLPIHSLRSDRCVSPGPPFPPSGKAACAVALRSRIQVSGISS